MATIYSITHKESGKVYVGQTWLQPQKRWNGHRSPFSGGGRSAIKAAICLYGADAFHFAVCDTADTQEALDAKEIAWIAKLNSMAPYGYNLKSGGKGGRHSDETKAKISAVKIAALGGHVGRTRYYRERSDEEVAAVRVEHHRKIADKKRGTHAPWRWRSVVRNDGVVFKSIKDAADEIGATYRGIIRVLNGDRKKIYGWTFEYGGVPSPQ